MANTWNGPVRPSATQPMRTRGGERVPGSGHVRYELSQAKKDTMASKYHPTKVTKPAMKSGGKGKRGC